MNSKIKIIVLLSFTSVVIFNCCTNLNDPGTPEYKYSLLFNLSKNSDKQKIYIYNISSLEDYQYGYLKEYDKYFKTGAEITLESNGIIYSNFHVETDTQGVRYYTSDNIVINIGLEYKLNVNINGYIIKGITKVPGDFNIISPAENQVIHYTNNQLNINYKWNQSSNASIYLLNVITHLHTTEFK